MSSVLGLHLIELNISETAVTDDGLRTYLYSPTLEKLNIANTIVSNLGMFVLIP